MNKVSSRIMFSSSISYNKWIKINTVEKFPFPVLPQEPQKTLFQILMRHFIQLLILWHEKDLTLVTV